MSKGILLSAFLLLCLMMYGIGYTNGYKEASNFCMEALEQLCEKMDGCNFLENLKVANKRS